MLICLSHGSHVKEKGRESWALISFYYLLFDSGGFFRRVKFYFFDFFLGIKSDDREANKILW